MNPLRSLTNGPITVQVSHRLSRVNPVLKIVAIKKAEPPITFRIFCQSPSILARRSKIEAFSKLKNEFTLLY